MQYGNMWRPPKIKKAFLTAMKNCIFDHNQLRSKKTMQGKIFFFLFYGLDNDDRYDVLKVRIKSMNLFLLNFLSPGFQQSKWKLFQGLKVLDHDSLNQKSKSNRKYHIYWKNKFAFFHISQERYFNSWVGPVKYMLCSFGRS